MTAAFRWEFRSQEQARRVYAEAELEQAGSPRDERWMLKVSLVRDEMRPFVPGEIIDPDMRVGMRVYVGYAEDAERVRMLAYLAPVEADRAAYTLIFNTLLTNPQAVEKFGDEWLTDTMSEATRHA